MLQIPNTTPFVYVMVEVDPQDKLGAPQDPTDTHVEMAFSPTRKAGTLAFHPAIWQANDAIYPTRYFVMCAVGTNSGGGAIPLAVGVWWPFVRVTSNPEVPDLPGEPFRIY